MLSEMEQIPTLLKFKQLCSLELGITRKVPDISPEEIAVQKYGGNTAPHTFKGDARNMVCKDHVQLLA